MDVLIDLYIYCKGRIHFLSDSSYFSWKESSFTSGLDKDHVSSDCFYLWRNFILWLYKYIYVCTYFSYFL